METIFMQKSPEFQYETKLHAALKLENLLGIVKYDSKNVFQ